MAQKNTPGANAVPKLFVKIVGGRHIRQFVEEQHENAAAEAECSHNPHTSPRTREDSAIWAGINQVPDRLCVTAPSGDRSRSYIHLKTPHVTGGRTIADVKTPRSAPDDTKRSELCSAVRQELSDWQLSSLRSAEDELAALDPSSVGTMSRGLITHQFLKHGVPLKLSTFSLLLDAFSDEKDATSILYRKLVQFIEASAFPEELQQQQ